MIAFYESESLIPVFLILATLQNKDPPTHDESCGWPALLVEVAALTIR